jgi:hypothetical protein
MERATAGEVGATPPGPARVESELRASTARATKKKVSITIDESLLDEVRAMAGDRPLSAVVNDLLATAVAQTKLSQLVDDMIAEAGPPPPEAYERVLRQWYGEDEA